MNVSGAGDLEESRVRVHLMFSHRAAALASDVDIVTVARSAAACQRLQDIAAQQSKRKPMPSDMWAAISV